MMLKILNVIVFCTIVALCPQSNAAHRQWRISEFVFQAEEVPEGQPYGVEFGASFIGPDGKTFHVPGFWDGGKIWRLRFTPTEPGLWTYQTTSTERATPMSSLLFETDVLRGGEAPQHIDISIAGNNTIRLVVQNGGDGGKYDHADWGDAAFIDVEGNTVYLDTLKPLSSKQGHGSLGLGKNVGGNFLKIGNRIFAHGIGSHSIGETVYALDKHWVRFRAWVGVDAQARKHGSVNFQVYAERFATERQNRQDPGLNGKTGTFNVLPAEGNNPFQLHGGILQVSKNRHYLTYADGTPFFWLGDTSWSSPSDLMPLDRTTYPPIASPYRALIEKRREQRFTILQMAFTGKIDGHNPFFNPAISPDLTPSYWRQVDRYIDFANENGILPALGMGWGGKPLSLKKWRILWRYIVARYGSHAVTWLVCGEYNIKRTSDEQIDETMKLGQFIKDIDPYKRAMSIHPFVAGGDKRQVWDEPWCDFIMIQGGHGHNPPSSRIYFDAYTRKPVRPVLESECKYEGIRKHLAQDVREVAYRAIQSGSFGYTYGSHGLWYPTQNENDPRHDRWGKRTPWWKSLERPGATHLGHMRTIYESIPWWNLVPVPGSVDHVIGDPAVTDVKPLYSMVEHFSEAKASNEYWCRLSYEPKGISMHPKHKKGDAILTFPALILPEVKLNQSIRLILAFGVNPRIKLKGKRHTFDGVKLGVKINGEERLTEMIFDKQWRYHEIDLTKESGKSIVIQLTANAINNAFWDHALFRQPVIVQTPASMKNPLEKQYIIAPLAPIFVKSIGKNLFFIYFPPEERVGAKELHGVCEDTVYKVLWRNPRTGGKKEVKQLRTTDNGTCILPVPPDEKDWVLILKRINFKL